MLQWVQQSHSLSFILCWTKCHFRCSARLHIICSIPRLFVNVCTYVPAVTSTTKPATNPAIVPELDHIIMLAVDPTIHPWFTLHSTQGCYFSRAFTSILQLSARSWFVPSSCFTKSTITLTNDSILQTLVERTINLRVRVKVSAMVEWSSPLLGWKHEYAIYHACKKLQRARCWFYTA